MTACALVNTQLRFEEEQGGHIVVNGPYAVLTGPSPLDTSVLGRDVLNLFACIVDRPGNAVCLLAPRHRYRIEVAP